MSIQLRLPVVLCDPRRDPVDRLAALRRDVSIAKAHIRAILDELGDRHGIAARNVDYAMDGYFNDMMGDTVYDLERRLEQEIEADDPV